jgi:uncharacterized protein with HEPN domain
MLPEEDRERLEHIVDAARLIAQFTTGLSEDDFRRSALVEHGVMNCLQIIGEAASRMTQDTRERHSIVEWDLIRGMRNRLAHAYFDINLAIVWYTATVSVPALKESVEQILAEDR